MNHPVASYQTGAPPGVSGDPFGGHATCNSANCHFGAPVDTMAAMITTNIPPTGYIPGDTFNIRATINAPGHVLFGFEISAQSLSGMYRGTILDTSADTQLTIGNIHYITQTYGGAGGNNTRTWAFNWIAPAAGSGNVTFFGSFNKANNNFTNTGDSIIVSSTTVIENVTTFIPSNSIANENNKELTIFPNPSHSIATVSLPENVEAITFYNTIGQEIGIPYTFNKGTNSGGEVILNTSAMGDGIYFITVKNPDGNVLSKRFIVTK